MDFKFVDAKGVVVATARNAREAKALLESDRVLAADHILLDDTGVEVSLSELEVLCAAEKRGI